MNPVAAAQHVDQARQDIRDTAWRRNIRTQQGEIRQALEENRINEALYVQVQGWRNWFQTEGERHERNEVVLSQAEAETFVEHFELLNETLQLLELQLHIRQDVDNLARDAAAPRPVPQERPQRQRAPAPQPVPQMDPQEQQRLLVEAERQREAQRQAQYAQADQGRANAHQQFRTYVDNAARGLVQEHQQNMDAANVQVQQLAPNLQAAVAQVDERVGVLENHIVNLRQRGERLQEDINDVHGRLDEADRQDKVLRHALVETREMIAKSKKAWVKDLVKVAVIVAVCLVVNAAAQAVFKSIGAATAGTGSATASSTTAGASGGNWGAYIKPTPRGDGVFMKGFLKM